MKVLHVIWNLGQGGAQTYLLNLFRCLSGKVECELLVQGKPGPLSEEMEKYASAVTYLGMTGGMDVMAFPSILGAIRKARPDVIHSHSRNVLFNLALFLQRAPVIYTEHGGGLVNGELGDRVIYRVLSHRINSFIAISQYMAGAMRRQNSHLGDRIRVIANGVDPDQIASVPALSTERLESFGIQSGPIVGFVGRLVKQKGVEGFLDIARRVLPVFPDASFVVVGEGLLREELEELAEEHGIGGRTLFLGYRREAIAIMKTFDVMLFTSRFEPFGLVVAEALAAGVPVVALDVEGAVSEIIRTEVDGLVIKGWEPERAAEAVIRLLRHPAQARAFAQNGGQRVRAEFGIGRNARQVLAEYTRLLGRGVER